MAGSGQKHGCLDTSDIADIFSPTFINPTFRFSPIVKYETWITKIRYFQTSIISTLACSQIMKTWMRRFANIRLFNIRLYSNIKTCISKIRDFQTSVFFIFTYGRIGKPRYQKSEIYKHPSFRYSPIVKYENLACKKSEIFKHLSFRYSPVDFQTSVFSIFANSQIRKLGSQKSEISKRPAEHPAFLIFKYKNLILSESNHLWSVFESQCPSIRSFYFYPKAKYGNLYPAFHENIKSWKC